MAKQLRHPRYGDSRVARCTSGRIDGYRTGAMHGYCDADAPATTCAATP